MVLADFGVTVVITKTDYNSKDMHSRIDRLFNIEIFTRLSVD